MQFKQAGGAPANALNEEAARWRDWVASTSTGDEHDITGSQLAERAEQIEQQHGEAAAHLFHRTATGKATMIATVGDQWLTWRNFPAKGEHQHRLHLALLQKSFSEVSQVTRKSASAFVEEILQPTRSASTVHKIVSSYLGLWRYMLRKEITVGANPWSEQGAPRGAAAPLIRRPFTEAEAGQLLGALNGVDLDVVRLLTVTGCRAEEICSLLVGDVTEAGPVTWLQIMNGKTAAAKRRVPVVAPLVRSMLRSRVQGQESPSSPMFPELQPDKHGDRAPMLASRLRTVLRRKLGIADKSLVGAHSLRHRARTMLEAAGVSPWASDAYMGHRRQGEGLSRYSKPSEEQLIQAARAIPLPA
jgi:integrase